MATRVIKAAGLTILLVIILPFVLRLCFGVGFAIRKDGIKFVNFNMSYGIKSPDEKYSLVELSDSSGRYLLYSVIRITEPGDPTTVFVADDYWYSARFVKEYKWIGDNDFFIDCSDSGSHFYRYRDNTWHAESA